MNFCFCFFFLLLQAAASQSKTVYRLPSLSSENVLSSSAPSSNSNSITSTNHLHFWKAGSQSPITSPSCATPTTTRQSQQRVNHILMVAWKFVKWPLALLLAATMIGALVYFLLLENELMTSNSSTKHTNEAYDDAGHNQHLSVGTSTTFGDDDDDDELQQQERTAINFLNHYTGINRNAIQSSAASTVVPSLASNGINPSTPITTTARGVSTDFVTKFGTTAATTTTTTKSPSKYSKTIVYTSSEETRRRKLPKSPPHTTLILNTKDISEENNVDRTKLLYPTKETLEIFGFTSGHQNNFGVPIEEDERVLRMLNEEMMSSQRKANKSKNDVLIVSTTDLNVYQTKVSPTLPILQKGDATTTERIRAPNGTDDGKSHARNHRCFADSVWIWMHFFFRLFCRHMPINIVAIMPWHFTVRSDEYEDIEIINATGFGTLSISDWVKVFDAFAWIRLRHSRARMSAGTNGTVHAVQTYM